MAAIMSSLFSDCVNHRFHCKDIRARRNRLYGARLSARMAFGWCPRQASVARPGSEQPETTDQQAQGHAGARVSDRPAAQVRRLRNFVDGEYVDSKDGRTAALIDPSTGEVFAEAPVSEAVDVDLAFRAAASAFPGWRDSTPSERSLALLRIADAFEARAGDLVAAETENTGKPVALTMSEERPPLIEQNR